MFARVSFVLGMATLGATFGANAADAACIYGSAVNGDGSKINGSAKISTSWNSTKAYPRNGKYELCFGGNPKQSITIYLDGSTYTKVHVNGDTRVDIRR